MLDHYICISVSLDTIRKLQRWQNFDILDSRQILQILYQLYDIIFEISNFFMYIMHNDELHRKVFDRYIRFRKICRIIEINIF